MHPEYNERVIITHNNNNKNTASHNSITKQHFS